MRGFYALFDMVIAVGPAVGAVLWFRPFWQHWQRLVVAWLSVSVAWVALDIVSVARGWWHYNPLYTLPPRLFGLPIEEIVFFFVAPVACSIVLYIIATRTDRRVTARIAQRILLVGAGSLLFCLAAQIHKERTVVDVVLALITIATLYYSPFITYRLFWYWNGAILGCFLLFNTLLTALPVVLYSDVYMTGLRIGTIPLEDFLYNFSFLNMFTLVFLGNHASLRRFITQARMQPTARPAITQLSQNHPAPGRVESET